MEWTAERLYSMATPEVLEQNRFKTISDFKWCMAHGGEVQFAYGGKSYTITASVDMDSLSVSSIHISEGYYLKDEKPYNALSHEPCVDHIGKRYGNADETLEYLVDGHRLRDILREIEVFDRTI